MDSTSKTSLVDRTVRNAWTTMQTLRRRRDESGITAIESRELKRLVYAALRRAFPDTRFELFIDGAGWGELVVSYMGGLDPSLVDIVVQPFAFDERGINWLLPDGRMSRAWRTDAYGDPPVAYDCPEPGAILVAGGPADVSIYRRGGAT